MEEIATEGEVLVFRSIERTGGFNWSWGERRLARIANGLFTAETTLGPPF